jgi:hypothetical protein
MHTIGRDDAGHPLPACSRARASLSQGRRHAGPPRAPRGHVSVMTVLEESRMYARRYDPISCVKKKTVYAHGGTIP